MKNLKTYILEASILGDIDDVLADGDVKVFDLIQKFLKENYRGKCIISESPNKDGLYEVSSNESIQVKNTKITSLTNGMFIWTSIRGNFGCSYCKELRSLEGAPKVVAGNFGCPYCNSLETLEGAPKVVGGNFSCPYCDSLKTLEGSPERVVGNFSCSGCKELKSLEGSSKKVKGYFDCSYCKELRSLEGAPKEVGGDFKYSGCDRLGILTKDYISKISKINGRIFC